MVINQFKITNNSNSKYLKFHYASSLSDNVTVKIIKYSKSGGTSTSNYASNWGGFDRIFTINFVLYNDGTDKSGVDSKVTLSQQWDYLIDTIIQGKDSGDDYSDVNWTITIYRDGSTTTKTGVIDNISVNSNTQANSNIMEGSLTLIESTN